MIDAIKTDEKEGDTKIEKVFLKNRLKIINKFIQNEGYESKVITEYVKDKKQKQLDLMHKVATRLVMNSSFMHVMPKVNFYFFYYHQSKINQSKRLLIRGLIM